MSDHIGHECGVAMVRLRRPLSEYHATRGDYAWGLRRLFLLMEKQRNRGQDGAGIAVSRFELDPGEPYLERHRADGSNAISRVHNVACADLPAANDPIWSRLDDVEIRRRHRYLGDVYLGHLRYATHADTSLANCHPRIRRHSRASKTLCIAGNFNLTNAPELFRHLVDVGLNPVGDSDTQVVLEQLGFSLDREHELLTKAMGPGSFRGLSHRALAEAISEQLDLTRIICRAAESWDGGWMFCGMLGNGDAFACRDPGGIRPGYWYVDDEVIAVASERPALVNVFRVDPDAVRTLEPGHTLVIKRDGSHTHRPYMQPYEPRHCVFERIYFSRGNDKDIYQERKALGESLAPRVLEAVDHDLDRTVFSYIPNTAETAFFGLLHETERLMRERNADALWEHLQRGSVDRVMVDRLMDVRVRAEIVAHKDQKLRTFITGDHSRRDLVLHIYDMTPGSVGPDDTLVVIDDSIVRGTTLRESIITILARLHPRRIIVVSSCPPILYPDCYGIDMSQLGRFVGFEAAVALARETGRAAVLDEIEAACLAQQDLPPERLHNHVARLYDLFSLEELSDRIARLLRPTDIDWDGELRVMYQSIEGLRRAIPDHTGDWYFTGDYPTPGGYRVLNTSFLNWRRNLDHRAY